MLLATASPQPDGLLCYDRIGHGHVSAQRPATEEVWRAYSVQVWAVQCTGMTPVSGCVLSSNTDAHSLSVCVCVYLFSHQTHSSVPLDAAAHLFAAAFGGSVADVLGCYTSKPRMVRAYVEAAQLPYYRIHIMQRASM